MTGLGGTARPAPPSPEPDPNPEPRPEPGSRTGIPTEGENPMCQRAVCRKCQGITYRGCGMHVDQVLAGVPQSQRCTCAEKEGSAGNFWRRLFGRN